MDEGASAVTQKVIGVSWEIDDKSYSSSGFKLKFVNTKNKTIIPFNNYNEMLWSFFTDFRENRLSKFI